MTTTLSNPTPAVHPVDPVFTGEHVPCDLCGGHSGDTVIDGRWPLVRCRDCDLVYMNPRPTPAHFGEIYDGSYYTNKPAQPTTPTSPRERTRDTVLQCFWGYPGPIAGLKKGLYRLLLRPLRNRVMPVPFSPEASVLDVGCGNGERLAELRRRGHTRLYGVELSARAARLARSASGAEVYEGTLECVHLPAKSFDLVIMNQVLEHVASPSATLLEIRRILRPGGLLYLTVPNYGSVESRLFGESWVALSLPHHLHHFTRDTLLRLLLQTGFEVQLCRTDSYTSTTVASLHAWAANHGGWRRPLTAVPRWVLLPATLICDRLGRGSILRLLAQTPDK